MPFISPGSVGSHVVAAAGCDTSITEARTACTASPSVAMGYYARTMGYTCPPHTYDVVVPYTAVPRDRAAPYITDISAAPAIVPLY